MLSDDLLVLCHEVIRKQLDYKILVMRQEGTKQIRLIPGPTLKDPLPRVFEGIEDVVEMHVDAAFKNRQDVKKNIIQIAAGFGDMTGVDE